MPNGWFHAALLASWVSADAADKHNAPLALAMIGLCALYCFYGWGVARRQSR